MKSSTEGSGAQGCAVCGGRAESSMSRVLVDGRSLELCRAHVGMVVAAMPETFEDLRALFVGAASRAVPAPVERRSPIARRAADDRRVFPPRVEGRRANGGRRAGDTAD